MKKETAPPTELVIITGLSGSGKGTVLKAFEDLGYYSVDNLPIGLIPKFAELAKDAPNISRAALVVDIREGAAIDKLPAMLKRIRRHVPARLLFLEADDAVLIRRFSETRRPHPLGIGQSVAESIRLERAQIAPIRRLADPIINTSHFNVHELRETIHNAFRGAKVEPNVLVQVTSFGYRHGVPPDSDLVFDVRFLPNPNYIPAFKNLSGKHPSVARYIRSFPQTIEFIDRISELLIYLIPHYIREGKSYLTISFGCTGGHHRSVLIANEIRKRLGAVGFRVKETHRDVKKLGAMQIDSDICRDFSRSSTLEWLETNGTGAFAMGTIAGVNTRRYHALLVASLRPPVERKVLLSRVEEEVSVDAFAESAPYLLGVCQYPGTVSPRGYEWLEEFRPDPCATWKYNLDGVSFEKQVYLVDGRQGVVIRYRADRAVTLRVRPFLAYRDYHSLGHARDDLFGGLPHLDFQHDGYFEASSNWYHNVEYLVELDRGLDFREDLYTPGVIVLHLKPDEWAPICATIDGAGYAAPTPRADPFTVQRADGAPTIIAGYPWFTDWGRDTMISLPGLLITSGRLGVARAIFETFLAHRNQGIIPNRFPDAGETPEYNTADATLWMFQAVRAWIAENPHAGHAREFLRDVFYPAAKEIIDWHLRGTWYGIGVDPADHLLRAGTEGTQLTWMDAKVGDWVVTPRHGKPVEINALWHGALRLMARWAVELGDDAAEEYREEADRVRESFRAKFWNPARNCLYDLIGAEGPVAKLRPNQIFAVSLPFDLLESDQRKAVVEIVQRELLTTVGLRTLERCDPEYKPRYQGSSWERDGAYHQGTVWPWLIGPFIDAYFAAFGRSGETLAYCRGLIERLEQQVSREGCPSSIAEIYDGDEPRSPKGCPAQAWSVAEVARVKASLHGNELSATSG